MTSWPKKSRNTPPARKGITALLLVFEPAAGCYQDGCVKYREYGAQTVAPERTFKSW
jgi:hypothetical protein